MIRFWLDQHRRLHDRAMFDFAIDSKLRGCDVDGPKIIKPEAVEVSTAQPLPLAKSTHVEVSRLRRTFERH